MAIIKRLATDLLIFSLFVAQYGVLQVMPTPLSSMAALLILSPPVVWIVSASFLAFLRAISQIRILGPAAFLWSGVIEWIAVFSASSIFTCWVDTILHPPESFLTVFGFNLFIVFVPSLILSTAAYCVTFSSFARRAVFMRAVDDSRM